MTQPPTVRALTPADLPAAQELLRQLGYPVNAQELETRLCALQPDPARLLLVAEREGSVIALAEACLRLELANPPMAELLSLVVDENVRGSGAGVHLLRAVEKWAAERGCSALTLGSRVERAGAHRFYEREGYRLEKVWHIYRRGLES